MEISDIIYREIISEEAGVWYISDITGSKILIKIPLTSIKAIAKKCKLQLLFGKEDRNNIRYLHIGLNVFDFSQNPLSLTHVCKHDFEQKAILEILKLDEIYVEFFNELDMCIAKSFIVIEQKGKKEIKKFIETDKQFYVDYNINSTEAELSLNNFQYSIDERINIPNAYKINILNIDIMIKDIIYMDSIFIGYNENNEITINTDNEGKLFENIVWAPLQSVFCENIFKNPQVCRKKHLRELTDILAYYKNGVFLIETKALSILNIVDDDINNHVDKIKKHIIKAINQLVGAKKVIERQESIFDVQTKREISVVHSDNPPHCIILVENIYPFGMWNDIVEIIYQTIIKEKIYLHILDLTEYIKLIKYSKGKIELIDYNLMMRCKLFTETRNIFIKGTLSNIIKK
jgi:hypothetical protein